MADQPKSRTVADTQVTLARIMLPDDANPVGNVHGGTIMKLIDDAAGAVAIRHARSNVVTASIDRLDFHEPVFVGDLLMLKAAINCTGRTSMEIGVRVEAEDMRTGKVRHTSSAYLTFVGLDDNGKPHVIAQIMPETDDQKRRHVAACKRREERRNRG